MTESSASTGVIVPALYIGQPDYVLSFDDGEPFDITASVAGRAIITGHDFRGPAMGSDPRDSPAELASMFGAFLGAEIETQNYGGIERAFEGWTIHDSDADLSNLTDACGQYGEDDCSC